MASRQGQTPDAPSNEPAPLVSCQIAANTSITCDGRRIKIQGPAAMLADLRYQLQQLDLPSDSPQSLVAQILQAQKLAQTPANPST